MLFVTRFHYSGDSTIRNRTPADATGNIQKKEMSIFARERAKAELLWSLAPVPEAGGEPRAMVQAMKGVLLKGDIPLKESVLSLNESRIPSEKFVIADLDERTLLIQPQAKAFLEEKLQGFVEENQYQPSPLRSSGHSAGNRSEAGRRSFSRRASERASERIVKSVLYFDSRCDIYRYR